MFAGFNLDLSSNSNSDTPINFDYYRESGEKHLDAQKATYEKDLEKYVINGTTDGTKLQDDWFPQVDADIFISHSHKDIGLAQGLAGWLYRTFGLKCFIDSNVWGYADKLLEEINSRYSDKRKDSDGGYLYSHEKSNTASKHVSVMLSIALEKMIDKTEATFVLNTNNSVQKYADVYETKTYSPWIYTEIICTELVRNKPLSEYRRKQIIKFAEINEQKSYDSAQQYSAAYKVSLEHLKNINVNTLWDWKNSKIKCNHPLDRLYLITHTKEMKKLNELYTMGLPILG